MKKLTATVASLALLMMFCVSLLAQQKKTAKQVAATATKTTGGATKKQAFVPVVTIGNAGFQGGPVKPADFSALLKQGLFSRDSAGNNLPIVSFNFIYMERNFYEDSTGEIRVMTDLSKESCTGNKINENIAAGLYDRLKGGDTVVIEQVLVTKSHPGQKVDTFLGKSIKSIIIK